MLFFGHLNINSLLNKFFSISELIKGKVDIFLTNETKLTNKFGGGIAFYITDQLPSQTLKIENPSDIEILTVKITIRKNKILVAGIYKPPNLSETDFATNLETILVSYQISMKN